MNTLPGPGIDFPDLRHHQSASVSGKTTSLASATAWRVQQPRSLSISIEDPIEIVRIAPDGQEPALDISILPSNVEYVAGYRNDVVVFARSIKDDLLVTNLPIYAVPEDKLALCQNVAEKILLAMSWAAGMSLRYLGEDQTLKSLRLHAAALSGEFLHPLTAPEKTIQYQVADVSAWLERQIWWRRSVEDPAGTEYA